MIEMPRLRVCVMTCWDNREFWIVSFQESMCQTVNKHVLRCFFNGYTQPLFTSDLLSWYCWRRLLLPAAKSAINTIWRKKWYPLKRVRIHERSNTRTVIDLFLFPNDPNWLAELEIFQLNFSGLDLGVSFSLKLPDRSSPACFRRRA